MWLLLAIGVAIAARHADCVVTGERRDQWLERRRGGCRRGSGALLLGGVL